MPQMAPLMWTSLFTLFALMLFLSMVKIMFSKKEMSKNSNNEFNHSQKSLNWKW